MVQRAWDDIGVVGIEPIDQDHQQMALMVSALWDAVAAAEIERARRLAALLAERFETHCLRERRLFVPDDGDVRHERITEQLAELTAALAGEDDDGQSAAALLPPLAHAMQEEVADDAVLVKTMCGQALDLAERRRYLRFRVALAVAARAAAGEVISAAQLVDISRGGCLLIDGADGAEVGEEIVLDVLGELFPGVLVASDEQGRHVRFKDHVESEHMARILLRGVIEPAALAREEVSG